MSQHLENLIKHDDYFLLPSWYTIFVHHLMIITSAASITAIYQRADVARGYLLGVFMAGAIDDNQRMNLQKLVGQNEAFAINNNLKKAA